MLKTSINANVHSNPPLFFIITFIVCCSPRFSLVQQFECLQGTSTLIPSEALSLHGTLPNYDASSLPHRIQCSPWTPKTPPSRKYRYVPAMPIDSTRHPLPARQAKHSGQSKRASNQHHLTPQCPSLLGQQFQLCQVNPQSRTAHCRASPPSAG